MLFRSAIFRDGILLGANPGAMPALAFEELIGKVRGVDMNEVKAEVASRQAVEKK